jgi:hypothetical protein
LEGSHAAGDFNEEIRALEIKEVFVCPDHIGVE